MIEKEKCENLRLKHIRKFIMIILEHELQKSVSCVY